MTRKIMDLMNEMDNFDFVINFLKLAEKFKKYVEDGFYTIDRVAGYIASWFHSEHYQDKDPDDYYFVFDYDKIYIHHKYKNNEPIRFMKPE